MEQDDLRSAAVTAVRWVSVARAASEVLFFAASVAMARLIPPAEFGRAAIAMIATSLAASLLAGVVAPRLVQRADLTARHIEGAAWLGAVMGVVLAALTLIAGAPAAEALLDAETADLVRLGAIAFLLAGVAVVPQALRQREIDFRRLSMVEVAGSLTTATTGVTLAVVGLDGVAVVAAALAGASVTSAALLLIGPRARPRPHRAEMLELVRFGAPAGIGSLGLLVFRNVDYAIVGARLGAAQLGAYWRAYQLGAEYQHKISLIVSRVSFPVYSRSGNLDEMRRIRGRIVRMHATVIFPLLALLVATAPELVPFVYGPAWEAAIVPTQILAAAGMIAAILVGTGPLMTALGRPLRLMIVTWITIVVYAIAIYIAAPLGLTAVSLTVVGVLLVYLVVSHRFLVGRYLDIPLIEIGREVLPALSGSALVLGITYPAVAGLAAVGSPQPVTIAAVGVLGLLVYAAFLRYLAPARWADLLLVAGRVRRRTAARSVPV